MRRLIKITFWGVGGLFALLVLIVVGFLAYRGYRQHLNAERAAIHTPNGIQEAMFVEIGGMKQWITIRGQNRNNPVLFMIDGGPGAANSVFVPSPWENAFTVVEWDQPGAGKTFSAAGGKIDPKLGIDEIAKDGVDIAAYLCRHLHKDKVGVLADSWGTIIGIHMIKLRPVLFYAYVGTGQIVNMRQGEALDYQQVLDKARVKHDKTAVDELTKIGPFPYRSLTDFTIQRKWAAAYESRGVSTGDIMSGLLFSPDYSLGDVGNWFAGFSASQVHFLGNDMRGPEMAVDLPALGADFQVSIFMFQGTADDYTPFSLAKSYFESIRAPQKLFVAAPGAGHYAAFSDAAAFRKLLVDNVRPLGIQVKPTLQKR